MPLIMTRELEGKGNYNLAEGRPCRIDKKTRKQVEPGDGLILHTAKAQGMVWAPWEIVQCIGGPSHEKQILDYCQSMWGDNSPIVQFSWKNEEISRGYLERHPQEKPKSEPGTAEYLAEVAALIARASDPDVGPGKEIKFSTDINTATPVVRDSRPSASRTARGKTDQSEVNQRVQDFATARYEELKAEQMANGRSDKQAEYSANKARDAATKRGQEAAA